MTEKSLDGQTAIVTGAGRGIGRAIAVTLAEHGARVALAARTTTELAAVQQQIEAAGGQAAVFPTDVSREADVKALVAGTVQKFGRLDLLINNAAIGVFGPLAELSTADWDRVMAINTRGVFLMCRESVPYLKQHAPSAIINISSVVGVKGYVDQGVYSASKHAVMGLSGALAKELQADGIRVHAVCPGGVDTEMVAQSRPDLDRSVLMRPQEIADIVLFLASRRGGTAVIDQIHVRRAASTPWA